ncbi:MULTISPECIES: translational GTPase TypA [Psychrilyobacter]|uniref:Large ribosomal subunit assembly factor BipA n=1 Tax=Psychrilyobacter piezotolerans TaxID=2293438 RepID=A0ABX9KD70_9FUSO|nr:MULTISPECIES: translational GTPase TypA [Psychrilyobacter]MCS5423138.1 translational GTPase TypA [Psychrilyobacter sp. S5]NDI79167.1 translational GTPase TypA [Psychrilyobacter piezotolerans]RDE58921.1 translational GTPase TypA [Psychrilyobacter sp. S5]REI39472.1 translational GTPase TypA [Psychrilyobacter piezotolerans]
MNIKNIAIIAHVDHGKTTLVDAMLRQSGVFGDREELVERAMDSNDIEKERGITILSKNASLDFGGYKINIVDTPGHADFGGEVQRILKMVDSVLLLVDAFEGVMPQTKYVLKQALEHGLNPIVVVNKIDRPNSTPEEVVDLVFDLFVELGANDHQLEFPVIFASAKNGFAKYELADEDLNMQPLFETIVKHVKDPEGDPEAPVQMLVTNISPDNYLGKLATGRIHNGVLNKNQEVTLIKRDGELVNFKITRIFGAEGMNRIELDTAVCGDIVTVAGTEKFDIGETIADRANPMALPLIDIDEPTLAMTFMVSTSPFVGREGKFVTSRNIWDRLAKEVEHNVSMKIERTESADAFIVKGRGELQLSILIENMRREGFELQVAKPQVIMRDIDGVKSEPIELAIIDVADEFTGVVIEKLGIRKGEMINMVQGTDGYTRLEFKVPARGLIGFRNEFMTETRGTGILNHSFFDYEPYKGEVPTRQRGVLISIEKGTTTAYSLGNVQSRGTLFANPGLEVYEGMIIGEHSRENDLTVNVTRGKQLTNMRASGTDAVTKLAPGREFTLEQALEYIADDELVEITPQSIRMRKKFLTEGDRKRAARGTVR